MDSGKIHFNEIWDEDIYISEIECEEWLEELRGILNDSRLNPFEKMQKVVDSVCG